MFSNKFVSPLRSWCVRYSCSWIGSEMSSAETFVESALKAKKVVIFSKSYCPYCTKAKNVMAKYKLSPDKYAVYELDEEGDCDKIQDYLQKKTGARSVPRVFVDGKFIGGGDDTARLDQTGELKQILESASAL